MWICDLTGRKVDLHEARVGLGHPKGLWALLSGLPGIVP